VVDTANVSILSTALREFAESLGFGDELVYNTDLVVTEMLTNVMSHGFKYTYPKPVTLIFLAFENAVVILLRDQGARIPEHVLKAINPDMSYLEDVPLEEMPEGGMGLTFMRMASARFSYNAAYAVEKPYNQLGLLLLGKSFSND
jgi:anti-sigma regulatory factor (Ser/Thr protein kinase)